MACIVQSMSRDPQASTVPVSTVQFETWRCDLVVWPPPFAWQDPPSGALASAKDCQNIYQWRISSARRAAFTTYSSRPSLAPFLKVFQKFVSSPNFKTLEPPCRRQGRPGGRGTKPKKGKDKPKRAKKRKGEKFFSLDGRSWSKLKVWTEWFFSLDWMVRRVWPNTIWEMRDRCSCGSGRAYTP